MITEALEFTAHCCTPTDLVAWPSLLLNSVLLCMLQRSLFKFAVQMRANQSMHSMKPNIRRLDGSGTSLYLSKRLFVYIS